MFWPGHSERGQKRNGAKERNCSRGQNSDAGGPGVFNNFWVEAEWGGTTYETALSVIRGGPIKRGCHSGHKLGVERKC